MEPELSTPCAKGRKRGGSPQEEKWTSGRQDFALLMTGGLTPIMPLCIVHDTAHAHPTGNIHQESRDQTGAPRAGVGLQPPASAANPDGADGADSALHRGDRDRVPAPLARRRARGRSFRSRGRRAVARRIAGKDSPPVARPAKVALPVEGTPEGSPARDCHRSCTQKEIAARFGSTASSGLHTQNRASNIFGDLRFEESVV